MDSRQELLFDADRHSHHDDDTESSVDTIEMAGLDEIPVTPARRSYGTYPDDSPDSETDSDIEEALLGSRTHIRGHEQSGNRPDTVTQVKWLVLEVRILPTPCFSVPMACVANFRPHRHCSSQLLAYFLPERSWTPSP